MATIANRGVYNLARGVDSQVLDHLRREYRQVEVTLSQRFIRHSMVRLLQCR